MLEPARRPTIDGPNNRARYSLIVVEGSSDQVRRVDLPSGPVTLEPLDSLAAQLNQLDSEVKQILQSSEAPIANARLKVEQAGELLMAHKTEWDTSGVANQIAAATQLQDGVSQLNQQIQDHSDPATQQRSRPEQQAPSRDSSASVCWM